MGKYGQSRRDRNRGVVLLLVLGLMAMFAMIVLAFMVVTANMADTAVNLAKSKAVVDSRSADDTAGALRTLVAGSNNRMSPIAPFGILENLYGNAEFWNSTGPGVGVGSWVDNSFPVYLKDIVYETIGTVNTPVAIQFNFEYSGSTRLPPSAIQQIFLESGTVITFKLSSTPGANSNWDNIVQNTSALIRKKEVVDPINPETWYLELSMTDSLRHFLNVGSIAIGDEVFVRMNTPAFSGTGAGHFAPGDRDYEYLDATSANFPLADRYKKSTPTGIPYRIPYTRWGNAAAPDLVPFIESASRPVADARSYWAHLINGIYSPIDELSGNFLFDEPTNPYVVSFNGPPQPVRMNPSYTAGDARNLFLAKLPGQKDWTCNWSTATSTSDQFYPSFHRPQSVLWAIANGIFVSGASPPNIDNLSVLRKLTPRPLQLDHWNFTGSNKDIDLYEYFSGAATDWKVDLQNNATAMNPKAFGLANYFARTAAPDPTISLTQWDVDNDNDGVREGIWIPSGLPIRTDKNDTPYATFYSFTIVDLDGRLNVNFAGNWDQLPQFYGTSTTPQMPFNYPAAIRSIRSLPVVNETNTNFPDSPYYTIENLTNPAISELGDWKTYDDAGNLFGLYDYWRSTVGTKVAVRRGIGFGPASLRIADTLNSLGLNNVFNPTPQAPQAPQANVYVSASNLLWRRNAGQNAIGRYVRANWGNIPNKINTSAVRGATDFGYYSSQPGGSDAGATNPATLEKYHFALYNPTGIAGINAPWRGKSTKYLWDFDFNDTAFRSYDPLGHQTYTYAPRMSENPYSAMTGSSTGDTPYTLNDLEYMLRYFDVDRNGLSSTLLDDLFNVGGTDQTQFNSVSNRFTDFRHSLTTHSSDIPAAPVAFVDAGERTTDADDRYRWGGCYGIVSLIEKCVRAELAKLGVSDSAIIALALGAPAEQDMLDALEAKIREITFYLVSLLPEEIIAGKKINLNQLAQKGYWLDLVFDDVSTSPTFDQFVSGGPIVHNYGLVKRMEFARGLYILLMALTYEDRNAQDIYDQAGTGLINPSTGSAYSPAIKYYNYFEGGDGIEFDLTNLNQIIGPATDPDVQKLKEENAEKIAHRLAQWCVNLIDFSDPDATMTPFYYDVNPFDGWWSWNDPAALSALQTGTVTQTNIDKVLLPIFDGLDHTGSTPVFVLAPKEQLTQFFYYAFELPDVSLAPDIQPILPEPGFLTDSDGGNTPAHIIRYMLLNLKNTLDFDLGCRQVWGLERPDLLLTETLSFHNMGIADTQIDEGKLNNTQNTKVDSNNEGDISQGDKDYDQVSRPKGSTYLELYCTANPNVEQSPELYDLVPRLDNDGTPIPGTQDYWQLNLAKRTPNLYPVWRVAIGESRRPHDDNDIATGDATQKLNYRKAQNNIFWHLEDDFDNFTFQPLQFRNLPAGSSAPSSLDDLEVHIASAHPWKYFNLPIARRGKPGINDGTDDKQMYYNTLFNGLDITATEEPIKQYENEIQLDRIVWFGRGNAVADKALADAYRVFDNHHISTSSNPTHLAPNQYFVMGPSEIRPIGARHRRSTIGKKYEDDGSPYTGTGTPPPHWDATADSNAGSFGVPGPNRIELKKLAKDYGIGSDLTYKWGVGQSLISGSAMNISEPLWLGIADADDPYKRELFPAPYSTTIGDNFYENANKTHFYVRDVPFEMLPTWSSNPIVGSVNSKRKHIPIAEDGIFGSGVVPAYKSAFLQRVADPNRAYHPISNPYITVDWNVLDLAVFTGEGVDSFDDGITDFCDDTQFPGNVLSVSSGLLPKSKPANDAEISVRTNAFSSRQWGKFALTAGTALDGVNSGSGGQKMFAPDNLKPDGSDSTAFLPNIFARAYVIDDTGNRGLENGYKLDDAAVNPSITDPTDAVLDVSPVHSLGYYNNRGAQTDPAGGTYPLTAFDNFNNNFPLSSIYYGSPGYFDSGSSIFEPLPYEYLPWNDAPFGSVGEMLLVPASGPGRFGVEFVRSVNMLGTGEKDVPPDFGLRFDSTTPLNSGGRRIPASGFGASLGAAGEFTDTTQPPPHPGKTIVTNPFGYRFNRFDKQTPPQSNTNQSIGPYLNFTESSPTPGASLNLGKLLDFVRTPSPVLGTRTVGGYDNDNFLGINFGPVMDDTMREPGKININTANASVWKSVSNMDNDPDELFLGSVAVNDFTTIDTPILYNTEYQPIPWQSATTRKLHQYANQVFQPQGDDPGHNKTDSLRALLSPDSAATPDPTALNPGGNHYETGYARPNLAEATDELSRVLGMTTNRSNVFAAWITVGYFEVERAVPGVNMPLYDPEGRTLHDKLNFPLNPYHRLRDNYDKYYHYYRAIYPDGYTYGKEIGSDTGDIQRHRSFSIIDRSVPVDFRRGKSLNWKETILLNRIIE